MKKRVIGFAFGLLALSPAWLAAQTTGPSNPTTPQHVICDSGCGGGTTATDNGTVATGQSGAIGIGLTYVYDGASWKRVTFGQAAMAASIPVVLASNQSAIDVHCTVGCTGGVPGQATMANSSPVVIASDQSSVATTNANLDIALSALRDAIVGAGPKTLTDVVTALSGLAVTITSGTVGLSAGSAIIGQVSIDQTGPNTNTVQAVQLTSPWSIQGNVTETNSATIVTDLTSGTQKTQIVDGSGNVIGSTANALNVNLASGTAVLRVQTIAGSLRLPCNALRKTNCQ